VTRKIELLRVNMRLRAQSVSCPSASDESLRYVDANIARVSGMPGVVRVCVGVRSDGEVLHVNRQYRNTPKTRNTCKLWTDKQEPCTEAERLEEGL